MTSSAPSSLASATSTNSIVKGPYSSISRQSPSKNRTLSRSRRREAASCSRASRSMLTNRWSGRRPPSIHADPTACADFSDNARTRSGHQNSKQPANLWNARVLEPTPAGQSGSLRYETGSVCVLLTAIFCRPSRSPRRGRRRSPRDALCAGAHPSRRSRRRPCRPPRRSRRRGPRQGRLRRSP